MKIDDGGQERKKGRRLTMSLKCVLKAITLSNSIDTKKYCDYVGFEPLER